MAVPQRRTSKTRKRLRRAHFYLKYPTIVECPHCGAMIQPHKVCPSCGYYDGKQVIAKEEKSK